MGINSLSNMLSFSVGKISRLALRIFSIINFFFHYPYFGKRSSINGKTFSSVVFRLDDIPYDSAIYDEARINVDLAVLDVFSKRNQNLTLGLVVRYLELHPKLLACIVHGYGKGIFELALHGWDHDDYSKLTMMDQERSLLRAKTKLENLFGNSSKIFIPPYNKFNRFTIDAMKKLGIKIISSSVYSDYHLFFMANHPKNINRDNHIYHLPEMVSFEAFKGTKPIRIPLGQLVNDVQRLISKYGYAIITLHPQSFVKFAEPKSTSLSLKESILDIEQINQLDSLIQMILDKNIRITNFSNLVGLN
jgi:peptidoglycan/xylan/chitin deacetylase (PgdA/CDA1 family)